jgi:hypothetical protein
LREPRKQPLKGKAVGLAAVMIAGCLAAASAADTGACPTARPSNFDFLVLASIADSPQLPAMAGYFNNTEK